MNKTYIIYETTNLLNGIKYLGMHGTDLIEDGYLGSGIKLVNAVNKHGRENFSRRVLHVFDNREQMIQMERELVTEEICESPLYYNMMVGGDGGRVCEESLKKIGAKTKSWWENATPERIAEKIAKQKQTYTREKHQARSIGEKNAMFGKKHTKEQKQKISDGSPIRDRRDHKFEHADGEVFVGQIADFYKSKNFCRAWASRVVSGEKKTIKGWSYKGLVE